MTGLVAWVRRATREGAAWCRLHLLAPLAFFWGLVKAGNLTLMRLLMAPLFFIFGAALLVDPTAFYESPAYFIMRAWASSQAWGLVAVSLAITMFITPTDNRFALRLLFFFGALYWSSVAFTVSTVNGLSGYSGILTVLSFYCALIMARAGVGASFESRHDV